MRKTDIAALSLTVIGALNWGLIAVAKFDLVAAIFGLDFGETNVATRVVYGVVGASGLWLIARARALGPTRQPQPTQHAHVPS